MSLKEPWAELETQLGTPESFWRQMQSGIAA